MNWKTLVNKCFTTGSCILLLILFSMLFTLEGQGQDNRRLQRMFEEARQLYTLQEYAASISINKKILARDPSFINARLLLADIYHATDSAEQEIVQLEKAAELDDMPQIWYRLGLACFQAGKYKLSLDYLNKYISEGSAGVAREKEIARITESCRFAIEAIENPVAFKPQLLPDGVNSANDEYWPSLSIDQEKLVFTRLMKEDGSMPQEDFFIAEFDSLGWGTAQPIIEINTPENEGAQSVSADGRLLFFTACNRRSGMGSCDIYYSLRQHGKWSAPRNIGPPVNSRHWEAQPSVSSDGRYLYFSSSRPGGQGNKDIWRVEYKGFDESGNLSWENPENLGQQINTQGNETSPFIHPNNKNFYFASDYHIGMGGFDVYMSEIKKDTLFSMPENLGYPINTFNDEQGLFFSADGQTAFFSSERENIAGLDIWSFNVPAELRPAPVTYVKAYVIDAESKKPVRALIELADINAPEERKRAELADDAGEVLMALPSGTDYVFAVSQKGYLFYTRSFELKEPRNIYDPYNLLIELQPVKVGSELHLYNVYFETDSFKILPESEPELQTLVHFLQSNPDLKVEIQGHTDSTGLDEFNQILSERRAKSVVEYLQQHAVRRNRLNPAGYGESKPVASNDTEEGRRLNRRVTIRIVSTEN